MHTDRVEQLLQYYREHTDQEFVKKILEALRSGELTDTELGEIGNWIAEHSRRRNRYIKHIA